MYYTSINMLYWTDATLDPQQLRNLGNEKSAEIHKKRKGVPLGPG